MKVSVKMYFDKEQTYEREKREDLERWRRYQRTGTAITHETVSEWLQALAQGQPMLPPKATQGNQH